MNDATSKQTRILATRCRRSSDRPLLSLAEEGGVRLMPHSPPRPCRVPMCAGKTTHKHGFCDKHSDQAVAWKKSPNANQDRGGRPWRRIRERILQRDKGLCQPCLKQGIYTPANEVDHIVNIAEGGTDNDDNLQAICGPCHKAKTQAEARRGRGADA